MKKLVLLSILFLCSISFGVVSNTSDRVSYTGNGSATSFAYTFPTTETSDIVVILKTIADDTESTLVEGVDYTATAGESGGTVTTTSAYSSSYEIHIRRVTPKTQSLDLTVGGAVNIEDLEDAYLAESAYEEFLKKGMKSIGIEELEQSLGLDD